MKWYKGIYRRNLVDMHIADWNEEFLSKFSPESYYGELVKAKIQSPMIYLQSHTGLCNFISESGRTHEYFKKHKNAINELIDLCKSGGMKVVGYYSLIFNNYAVDKHPEWEMRYKDGSTWRDKGQRYGLCCPNNNEYRKFVALQVEEISRQFGNLDGIFFDMPYWEVVCYCDECKKRYKKETGRELPAAENWNDDNWRIFVKKRQEWMAEFALFAKNTSLSVMPDVTVELNYAAGIACDWLAGATEGINEACEFTGGDLYGDLYNHSFTCKYYYSITKNQPFEYMTCRCNKKLREHTISKSEKELESEVMLTAAHHGASLIIDAINPNGTLDGRCYERLGKVFDNEIPYEDFMDKGKMYASVAVYYDSTTQFSVGGKAYNKECAISAVRTMIENHVPVRVIANGCLDDISSYKLIIAPSLETFGNDEILKFITYVENGGTLYISGKSDERLINKFFGGRINTETYGDSPYKHVYKGYDEVQCYVFPVDERYIKIFGEFNEEYPLPITYKLPIMEDYSGEVKAKIVLPYTDPDDNGVFASIHSNPPAKKTEFPAIIEVGYGKGKVIWSAATIENDERQNFKDIFLSIVNDNADNDFKLSASKYVEEIVFKDGLDYYVNLFDLNFAFDETEREFILFKKGYEATEVLSGEKLSCKDGEISGKFRKYMWIRLRKI